MSKSRDKRLAIQQQQRPLSERLLTVWIEDDLGGEDEGKERFRTVWGYCGENARDGFTEFVKRSDYAALEAKCERLQRAIAVQVQVMQFHFDMCTDLGCQVCSDYNALRAELEGGDGE
jgi:hypothetical protein